MKADLDSIVVIIITLLFLVITGLSRSRRKKPVMKSTLQDKQNPGQFFKGQDLLSDAVTMINDPFAKLEKMFNIPEQSDSQEAEFPEEMPAVQKSPEIITTGAEVSKASPVTKEPQSSEVIVDEVKDYFKWKETGRPVIRMNTIFDDMDLTKQEKAADNTRDQKKKIRIPVFENIDEIKKAVIYSEILNRKDF
jgi:hypothetical protein